MTTIAETAAGIEGIVNEFAKIEPTIATVASMFVPGAAPIVAIVQPWAPVVLRFVQRAIDDIAKSNGGDVVSAFLELMNHISKGAQNSPALAPDPQPAPSA